MAPSPDRYVVQTIGETPQMYDGKEYWNANVVAFDGQTYVISHRAILTLVTTSSCNAACHFCSNEITFTTVGPYLRFDERLARIRELALLAGVSKIAFTGGEPTANPKKLYQLVRQAAPGFKQSRLHTNSFGLFHEVETETEKTYLLKALIDSGLTGVSVSVAHFDTETNRRIMRFKTRWMGPDEADLRRIAAHRSSGGRRFTPRLSCVMTQEGVKTTQDILDYMSWGRELGFRRFIFRSPSGIPEEYSKGTEFTVYNRENHIDIDSITSELQARAGWKEVFSQHKSDSHVHVFKVDDEVYVDIDESSEEEDPDDKIRRLNVMPTGVTYTSWIDPLSNLFSDERAQAIKDARSELPNLVLIPTEDLRPS